MKTLNYVTTPFFSVEGGVWVRDNAQGVLNREGGTTAGLWCNSIRILQHGVVLCTKN